MAVDTYARKADLSPYRRVRRDGAELLVAKRLAAQAVAISLELRRFLMFRWLKVNALLYGHAT